MTIRLTLRTLLSYLDDTLEPAQAKIIGAKVAESDQARELMERIKQVTRRRRLMTPTTTGPGGIDPNTIAEYLDNDVTPEQAAEVEQICLASDVHLAEVAACHQILTLVLGEPALVPPSAKQRMYGLTKGPEAIPFRKPAKAASRPENDLSSEIEPDQDESLRMGVPAVGGNGSQRNLFLLVGVGVLVVCLLIVAVWNLMPRGPSTVTPQKGGGDQQVAKADDKAKDKTDVPKDGADAKPEPKKDKDEVKPPVPKIKQGDNNPAVGEPKTFDVPPPAPAKVAKSVASDEQTDVGKHIQENTKDLAVLLQKGKTDKAGWLRVPGNTPVVSGRPLLSLPGNKCVVILGTGIKLTLWGNLPELTLDAASLESRAVVHVNKELQADLTLQRGRIILQNLTENDAVVRLRFNNPTLNEENHFDITLNGNKAAVVIERHSELDRDEPFYENAADKMRKGPTAVMSIFASEKSARVSSDDATFLVDDSQPILRWQSRQGTLGPPSQRTPPPAWLRGTPPLKNPDELEARAKFVKAAKEVADSLEKDKRPVDVALSEALQDAQDAFQREFGKNKVSMDTIARWRYAIRCLRGIDKIDKLFATFVQESTPPFIRGECMSCLQQWLALDRDNDYKLLAVVRDNDYPPRPSIKIMELFHWISVEDERNPGTYQVLIEGLNNDKLPIRFLSASHLYPLAPAGANIRYDAAMSRPEREAAVRAWMKLIPPGRLPPPPTKK